MAGEVMDSCGGEDGIALTVEGKGRPPIQRAGRIAADDGQRALCTLPETLEAFELEGVPPRLADVLDGMQGRAMEAPVAQARGEVIRRYLEGLGEDPEAWFSGWDSGK